MNVLTRRKKILELLKSEIDINVEKLAHTLKVSTPTIYRDLKYLEKNNLINRNIINYESSNVSNINHSFSRRLDTNTGHKKAIAHEAVKLINEKDIIAIDASSTCYYLCKELKNIDIELTIFTNSVYIPVELMSKPNYKVIVTGGILNREIASLVKTPIKDLLKNVHLNKFFLSAIAMSPELGIFDEYGMDDIVVRQEFFNISKENILLIDSTKFSVSGTYNWASCESINTVITNKDLDKDNIRKLKNKNFNLILV